MTDHSGPYKKKRPKPEKNEEKRNKFSASKNWIDWHCVHQCIISDEVT